MKRVSRGSNHSYLASSLVQRREAGQLTYGACCCRSCKTRTQEGSDGQGLSTSTGTRWAAHCAWRLATAKHFGPSDWRSWGGFNQVCGLRLGRSCRQEQVWLLTPALLALEVSQACSPQIIHTQGNMKCSTLSSGSLDCNDDSHSSRNAPAAAFFPKSQDAMQALPGTDWSS